MRLIVLYRTQRHYRHTYYIIAIHFPHQELKRSGLTELHIHHNTYTLSNGGVYSSIDDGYTSGGKALLIKKRRWCGIRGVLLGLFDVDLSNISQLSIYTKFERYATINRLVVRIDGTAVLNTNSNHSWTDRTFDVSSYSGVKTISLALYNSNSSTNPSYYSRCWFSDLRLVKS